MGLSRNTNGHCEVIALDEAAALAALRPFGIRSAELRLVTEQPDRAVWQVATAETVYALKCSRLGKRAPKIVAVTQYLADRGVPVVRTIPTTAGDPFVTRQDCSFLLFPWVTGARPLYEDRSLTRPMASLLAQFHEASRGYVASGGPSEDRLTRSWHTLSRKLNGIGELVGQGDDPWRRQVGEYLPWIEARVAHVEAEVARSTAHAALLKEASRSPLLVHGDYSAVNLLVDEGGRLTIIDLDDAATALPVWEIARFIGWMNHDSLGWSGDRFEAVLTAYRQVRPLSALEEELLRLDLLYPRQAVSLIREYCDGSAGADLCDRFAQCIANDINRLRYLGVTI